MLRRFKSLAVFLVLLSSSLADAGTILVNQPSPYYQYTTNDASMPIYIAGRKNFTRPTIDDSIDTNKGYRYIDTTLTTDENLIYLDVSTTKAITVAAGQEIAVVIRAVGGSAIRLTGAGIGTATVCGGNCLSTPTGAFYEAGTTLRVSFSVTHLCAAAGTGNLCDGGVVVDTANKTLSQNIDVLFGAVVPTTATDADVVTASGVSGTGDQLIGNPLSITDINPTTSCPSGSLTNYYFPGDGQIYLYASNFGATPGTGTAPYVGVPLQYLLTMGLETTGDAFEFENNGLSLNSIVHYTPASATTEEITGFTNTTTGADHQYSLVVQAQNKAGLVSPTTSKCSFKPVQSQDISGILKESKCFIATAAYHDGRAAPVMMLRKFRDQILSKFSLGQNFIQTYYQYSPSLAEWAWDKPIIRSFALKLLAPIELMAWAILKFSEAEEVPVAPSAENESYIDRLKKSLSTENEAASTGSYSEQEKKKLEASQSSSSKSDESYIDRMKKRLAEEKNTETSPEQYSEKEKQKLPPEKERESPIKVVKEGRDHHLDLGEMSDIKNAAGIKFGVTPGMQVTVAGGVHTFTDVYGSGFQPELLLHYEHQLFHSENFGSFGLGVDTGMAYSGGKGLLQFGFNGSSASRTGFSFIQVPLTFSGIYRFNLMRVIRPYISAGAGAIFYTETREDAKKDRRGYSAVYNGSLGVSVLMDFLDKSTRRDSYLSNGIQHTYLFLEYLYLNTFKSNVAFKRAGIYSGFLFEF